MGRYGAGVFEGYGSSYCFQEVDLSEVNDFRGYFNGWSRIIFQSVQFAKDNRVDFLESFWYDGFDGDIE